MPHTKQKKQKEQAELVGKLSPGARVMTTAGVFGTVRHLGERQAILEIAPGVEMTVLKQAIMRAAEASEDEFEYDDDVEQLQQLVVELATVPSCRAVADALGQR